MNLLHHLSWENFRATIFLPGQQRVHRVTGSPLVELFGDGLVNRVGIWLETEPGTVVPSSISKLSFVTTRVITQKDLTLLEVATSVPTLYRQFYYLTIAVAERMVVEKRSAIDAVSLELQCFTDLLQEKALLGPERQIGLLGELVFLERLYDKLGTAALDTWIGPLGEPHDFRFRRAEFEVKTTISPHRIHTIHGTEQLVPSMGCSLYLVSILLGPSGAGDGFSLVDKIDHLSSRFGSLSAADKRFATVLEACGFRKEDREHYTRHFVLRRPIAFVQVDNRVPSITRPALQSVLGTGSSRIEYLQYDLNFEGLEHEDGTSEFNSVLEELI